jgi:hypothetical protein
MGARPARPYNGGMPGAAPPADPHLARLWEIAREVVSGTERLTAGLSETQLKWRPAPERWSVAQCFAHLVATGEAYYPRVQGAVEAARAKGIARRRPFRPSWFGARFIAAAGPEVKVKIRAFRVFRPADDPPADSPRRFLAQQQILFRLLADADGLDLERPKVSSPVSRLLRLSLGEALTMLAVHEQRHLLQAERVTREPGFPGA